MAVIEGGTTAALAEVDSTFKAMRISARPIECIGMYSVSGNSGALTGVAANGAVFSFRNTGSNLILIRRVELGFITTTAFTTAQGLKYALIRANSFTASDTGGTSIFTAGQNKHRNSFTNITSAPDIRISSTGALGAGTRTLETNPMSTVGGSSVGVGTGMSIEELINDDDVGHYPTTLAQNEGFVITNLIAMGAAGVISLHVNIEFAEVSSY